MNLIHLAQTSLAAAALFGAQAMAQHRLSFTSPVVLTSSSMMTNVDTITHLLRGDKNKRRNYWERTVDRSEKQSCVWSLSLEGRDLAIVNSRIGEHYFGTMTVKCSDFSTFFRRVLVRGIRSCIESETAVDSDYCNLQVLAFRRTEDLSLQSKDLIRDDDKERSYKLIHSDMAQKIVETAQLIPAGLKPQSIDSYQSFLLNIDRRTKKFSIEAPEDSANFSQGRVMQLSDASGSANRDAAAVATATQSLRDLESLLTSFSADVGGDVTQFVGQNRERFVPLWTAFLNNLLTIINPSEFKALESQGKDVEARFVARYTTLSASSSNKESLVAALKAEQDRYASLSKYTTQAPPESSTLYFFSKDAASRYNGTSVESGAPVIAAPSKRESDVESVEILGKIFLGQDESTGNSVDDKGYGVGPDNDYYGQGACTRALKTCNRFISGFRDAPSFTCVKARVWVTSARRYCEYVVKSSGN
jgi:hypothetical protein